MGRGGGGGGGGGGSKGMCFIVVRNFIVRLCPKIIMGAPDFGASNPFPIPLD